MSFNTSNYGAARGILGFSELVLWCGVGLGVIVAIVAGGAASSGFGASGILAAIPGIAISVFCFVGVVVVQMAKATVDTADYSYQMLSVARDQLKVSKQTLTKASAPMSYSNQAVSIASARSEVAGVPDNSMDQPEAVPTHQSPNRQSWEYRGKSIKRTAHGYLFNGHSFDSLELAKVHIDGEVLRLRMNGPPGSSS